ncbi:hypothetical protein CSUI_010680, partial [Cystoisospora suis]
CVFGIFFLSHARVSRLWHARENVILRGSGLARVKSS